jgi:hypothetical protein
VVRTVLRGAAALLDQRLRVVYIDYKDVRGIASSRCSWVNTIRFHYRDSSVPDYHGVVSTL